MKKRKQKDPYMQLYKAVCKYVEAHGGSVAVAGGIQVIQWPDDSEHKFTIGVKCLGRKPKFKPEKDRPD